MFASLRRVLPRLGKWPRMLLAASCLLLALDSALTSKPAASRPTPSTAVVVAAHPLPAGHVITRRDLTVARWPPPLRPAGARGNPAELVGRRLAGPIGGREAVTPGRLVGAGLAAGLADGLVAAGVPLSDPHAVELVRRGERVDILEVARPPDVVEAPRPRATPVRTVAAGCLVLAVLPASPDGGAELVVAIDRPTAVAISRDSARDVFTAVVNPP